MEPATRSKYANVTRWFNTLVHQPQFKAVLGEVKLCENIGASAAAYASVSAKAGKGQQGGDKPKKDAKAKKEAKPKSPAPPKEEAEEEDDGFAKEAPSKDPFEKFPKG